MRTFQTIFRLALKDYFFERLLSACAIMGLAAVLAPLLVLAENIGLAMMYTRLLNALKEVKDTVNDVHSIWFNAIGG